MDKSDTFSVFLMVLLLAFAVIIVDERWLRAAIAVLPALVLAQRALDRRHVPEPLTGAAERRMDDGARAHIDELLKHFREFYATTHMMGMGALTPKAAEERAATLERDLNRLLARIITTARAGSIPEA